MKAKFHWHYISIWSIVHGVKKHIMDSGKSTLLSDLSSNFSDARETVRL